MPGTNPVGSWVDSNVTSQGSSTWAVSLDAAHAVAKRVADSFAPHPPASAGMSVVVDAGFIVSSSPAGNQSVAEVAQQTQAITAAPSSPNNRTDIIHVDARTGAVGVANGTNTSSTTPFGLPPALPAGKTQVALVWVPNGTSAIGASNITDVRAVWGGGGASASTPFAIASGTANALAAAFTPATPTLGASFDGYLWHVRATAANTTTTPTFAPDGQGPWTIKKTNSQALVVNDIAGAGHEMLISFNWNGGSPFLELINPGVSLPTLTDGQILANISGSSALPSGGTLSAIIDHVIASTRGDVLVRGASAWGAVDIHASGKALVGNGTDAVATTVAQPGQGVSQFSNDSGYLTSTPTGFGNLGTYTYAGSGSTLPSPGSVYGLTGLSGSWECMGAPLNFPTGCCCSPNWTALYQRIA